MDFLSEIIEKKRLRIEAAKSVVPPAQMLANAAKTRVRATPHTLLSALIHNEGINIIAEFKRRSPSKGIIRADAEPATIARDYQSGGAVGISVLTEEDFFAGSMKDLRSVKEAVDLPVLRKDFIVDEYQIYEAAAAEADAILLIVAALDDPLLTCLRQLTEDELGMDALVEVHTASEMRRAVSCGATLVGVNNRNLSTFEVSLETSVELSGIAPRDSVLISESGLHSASDLHRLREVGYRGFLIGESLMRSERPDQALRSLLRP